MTQTCARGRSRGGPPLPMPTQPTDYAPEANSRETRAGSQGERQHPPPKIQLSLPPRTKCILASSLDVSRPPAKRVQPVPEGLEADAHVPRPACCSRPTVLRCRASRHSLLRRAKARRPAASAAPRRCARRPQRAQLAAHPAWRPPSERRRASSEPRVCEQVTESRRPQPRVVSCCPRQAERCPQEPRRRQLRRPPPPSPQARRRALELKRRRRTSRRPRRNRGQPKTGLHARRRCRTQATRLARELLGRQRRCPRRPSRGPWPAPR